MKSRLRMLATLAIPEDIPTVGSTGLCRDVVIVPKTIQFIAHIGV